ncbi:hypothetical protein [Absidia glauca]|uniref:Uncharacterized protein n=1 Tax=Absidia glauca TaxID=4829 RepID=A0A168R6Y6_ABSGL|nr:hypothetical protein [Absidia glauca]
MSTSLPDGFLEDAITTQLKVSPSSYFASLSRSLEKMNVVIRLEDSSIFIVDQSQRSYFLGYVSAQDQQQQQQQQELQLQRQQQTQQQQLVVVS